MDQSNKLSLLNQIRKGVSKVENVWIKHPNLEDECNLEQLHSFFFDLAKKNKVKTEEECLNLAKKNKSWTNEMESKLVQSRLFLGRLKENLNKQIIEAQKKDLEKDIQKTEANLNKLFLKKSEAIGKTAESWAEKMASERYVLKSIYKDQNLNERVWSDEEIEYLDEDEVGQAYELFFHFQKRFSENELKSISIYPICQNLYSCSSSCIDFFGQNVLSLTMIQQRFFSLVKNYYNIIDCLKGKVKSDVFSDWEKLDKWAFSDERARESIERTWRSGENKMSYDAIRKNSISKKNNKLESVESIKKLLSE